MNKKLLMSSTFFCLFFSSYWKIKSNVNIKKEIERWREKVSPTTGTWGGPIFTGCWACSQLRLAHFCHSIRSICGPRTEHKQKVLYSPDVGASRPHHLVHGPAYVNAYDTAMGWGWWCWVPSHALHVLLILTVHPKLGWLQSELSCFHAISLPWTHCISSITLSTIGSHFF